MPSTGGDGTLRDLRARISVLCGIPPQEQVLSASGLPEELVGGDPSTPLKDCPGLSNQAQLSLRKATPTPAQREGRGVVAVGGGGDGGMSETWLVLSKAIQAGVVPVTQVHQVGASLHCLLISRGFVCTAEVEGTGAVKGFAPPMKDVTEHQLVPTGWDADAVAVRFRYRRPDTCGTSYILSVLEVDASKVLVTMVKKGEAPHITDVDTSPLSNGEGLVVQDEGFYEALFGQFQRDVLLRILPPGALPRDASPPQQSPIGQGGERRGSNPLVSEPGPGPTQGLFPDEDDPLRVGPPRFGGPPVPPGMDHTPFLPGRRGDFDGDLFPGGLRGLPGPGGLAGPDHPMFGGGGGR
ncbi:unnamed protein product [Choristocarpus tenellus]